MFWHRFASLRLRVCEAGSSARDYFFHAIASCFAVRNAKGQRRKALLFLLPYYFFSILLRGNFLRENFQRTSPRCAVTLRDTKQLRGNKKAQKQNLIKHKQRFASLLLSVFAWKFSPSLPLLGCEARSSVLRTAKQKAIAWKFPVHFMNPLTANRITAPLREIT